MYVDNETYQYDAAFKRIVRALTSLTLPKELPALTKLMVRNQPLLTSLGLPKELPALAGLTIENNGMLTSLVLPADLPALETLKARANPCRRRWLCPPSKS